MNVIKKEIDNSIFQLTKMLMHMSIIYMYIYFLIYYALKILLSEKIDVHALDVNTMVLGSFSISLTSNDIY